MKTINRNECSKLTERVFQFGEGIFLRGFVDWMIDRLNKENGVTILMASHDMAQVGSYASRVIVMNQKMEFDGDANEWLGRDNA